MYKVIVVFVVDVSDGNVTASLVLCPSLTDIRQNLIEVMLMVSQVCNKVRVNIPRHTLDGVIELPVELNQFAHQATTSHVVPELC